MFRVVFLRQGQPLNPELTVWARMAGQQALGTHLSPLPTPRTGITGTCCPYSAFKWMLGTKLRSPCLHIKHFTHRAIHQSQQPATLKHTPTGWSGHSTKTCTYSYGSSLPMRSKVEISTLHSKYSPKSKQIKGWIMSMQTTVYVCHLPFSALVNDRPQYTVIP